MTSRVPGSRVCEKCAREFNRFLHTGAKPEFEPLRAPAPRTRERLPETRRASAAPKAPAASSLILTGSHAFDRALGGGLPLGSLLLVRTQEGAGGIEFALTVLRHALRQRSRRALFLTALRSPERARRETAALFGATIADAIHHEELTGDLRGDLHDLDRGDAVVVEDAASIGDGDPSTLAAAARDLGEIATERGALVALLQSAGTLPALDEAKLEAHADVVLDFRWTDSPTLRRRTLAVTKLRGLAPALEANAVRVFELEIKRGQGVEVVGIVNLV